MVLLFVNDSFNNKIIDKDLLERLPETIQRMSSCEIVVMSLLAAARSPTGRMHHSDHRACCGAEATLKK